MKKIFFGLITTSLFLVNSGFTNLSSKLYSCHIDTYWHNSSGQHFVTHTTFDIGPNGSFSDCVRIAAQMDQDAKD